MNAARHRRVSEPPRSPSPSRKDSVGTIGTKAERKVRARAEGERSVFFGLGMFGLVGWSVALPTVAGIAAGVWLDEALPPSTVSWTLTGLVVGVALGCVNAWYWVSREGRK